MSLKNRRKKRPTRPGKFILITLFLLIAAGAAAGYILFFEGDRPSINLDQTKEFIGKDAVIHYAVKDGQSGIKSIAIWGTQGNKNELLYSQTSARAGYYGAVGPLEDTGEVAFSVNNKGFKEGPMTITVEAVDFSMRGWLQGNKSVAIKNVTIDTVAPRVQILHSEKYISQGGSGIAIYRLSDQDSIHGVELNGHFHPGFLVGDGRTDIYIVYFAVPYDVDGIESLHITARDQAGNSVIVPFSPNFKAAKQKVDTINISNGFLNTKIPEFQQYYPEMTGEFIDKYLYANNTIRIDNNQKISSLCNAPTAERLWKGRFRRMPGSSRAGYADHRTYFFKGKAIDKQVHLGMDIASTRRASVRAANNGKVIFTDYLGIYGNMVLVDHGQGVFSLYSHLSQINVAPGDMVTTKTVLGLTGTTGMAGGDHLHFSMLVNGIFVTPKEWWDPHWIEVTIEEPLVDSRF